jgi:predicted GIY-YIG superfamily endonuclease
VEKFSSGESVSSISASLGRTELAIRSRLGKLGLLDELSEEDVRRAVAGEMNLDWDKTSIVLDDVQVLEEPCAVESTRPVCDCMYSVYALVNSEHCIYIGYSANPNHRIAQHNANNGATATRDRGPWLPFALYHYITESDARRSETHFRRFPDELVLRTRDSLRKALRDLGEDFDEDALSFL